MPRKPVSIPFGLIVAVALIVAIEVQVASKGDFLATYSGLGARFAARAASSQPLDGSILGLGDSVMKFGFDPKAITDQTGVPAYNLAVPGTPPPLALALLRRVLNTGARPKALVVGMMSLSGNPKVHVSDFAEAFSLLDTYELARDAERSELFGEIGLARLLPSVRYRHALRGTIVAALGGTGEPFAQSPALSKLATWAEHLGHEPRAADQAFDGRMEPELERRVYSTPWQVESAFEKALRRLSGLAADQGIPVFWLVPPISPEAQARREALGLEQPHTRNLRATLQRIPNATLIDARRSGYPASVFFDSCHLNAEGAARLSTEVAQIILNHQGGDKTPDRWVSLPPFSNKNDDLATKKGDSGRR